MRSAGSFRVVVSLVCGVVLAGCGSDAPKLAPESPLATPNVGVKYPGITITGPPMTPDQLAMIEAVAKRDYLFKTMREKAPASYAALATAMTPDLAQSGEKYFRALHTKEVTSTGWGTLKVLTAAEYFDGAAVKFCSDSRGWKLTVKDGKKTDIYVGGDPEIRIVGLIKRGPDWIVSSNQNKPVDPNSADAKVCTK